MKAFIVFGILMSFAFADKIKVWKERNGLVIVEAENVQNRNALPINWELEKFEERNKYEGVVQWKGTSYIKETYDDITDGRILTYYLSIQKEGDYYLKAKGICYDEYGSELLIRIDDGLWKKYKFGSNGIVFWDSNLLEDSYPIFFPMGYHRVQVAGIYSGFLFDKFMMIHSSLIDVTSEKNIAIPFESKGESNNEYLSIENLPAFDKE